MHDSTVINSIVVPVHTTRMKFYELMIFGYFYRYDEHIFGSNDGDSSVRLLTLALRSLIAFAHE